MTDQTFELALEAGLRYVEAGTPGYRRVRRGKGFAYLTEGGDVINGKTRERIANLVIPPAWEDVWVSSDPQAHILATGHDKAGRKQYIYHPRWEEVRDEVKFDRLAPFGHGLHDLRGRVESDLRKQGMPRDKVVALAVAVLDRTLVRVGNRKYAADNESYGLTTLRSDHVAVEGRNVHVEFTGKGGAERQLAFEDRRLARLASQCQELGGQTLFSYQAADGRSSSVSSSDINAYLSEAMGGPFTAKDFRTWGASSLVFGELARSPDGGDLDDRIRDAIDMAADRLGNARAVCRDSYVHPLVLDAAENDLIDRYWGRSRSGKWLSREESALRKLLDA